jgi:hypothetical protein
MTSLRTMGPGFRNIATSAVTDWGGVSMRRDYRLEPDHMHNTMYVPRASDEHYVGAVLSMVALHRGIGPVCFCLLLMFNVMIEL